MVVLSLLMPLDQLWLMIDIMSSYIMLHHSKIHIILFFGIPTPLKNDGVKVSWDDYSIPNCFWKNMFQTTKQYINDQLDPHSFQANTLSHAVSRFVVQAAWRCRIHQIAAPFHRNLRRTWAKAEPLSEALGWYITMIFRWIPIVL